VNACQITECRATLLGFHYFAVALTATEADAARTVVVCPACMRRIRAAGRAR
jgi:hypothetical protein